MRTTRIPVRMREEPAPQPARKTRLPKGCQWLHHETAGSRSAQRRLRQMERKRGGDRG